MSEIAITVFGISIIFVMTTLGAALVFFVKKGADKPNTLFIGFASGIMIAAAVWSLLLPSIDQAGEYFGNFAFVPATVGFMVGGLFLALLGRIVKRHGDFGRNMLPGKSAKMVIAVTVHNIPEGLAVGFAFGAAYAAGEYAAYVTALMLAVGIAIQNFPEGAAVSLPLCAMTGNKAGSFAMGTLSGVVEPIFAVIGYFLAAELTFLQPWLLAFAAGAMIFVVADDLIPDAHAQYPALAVWGVMAGFAVMMILDVALG